MLYRNTAVHCQFHVFDHLACIELNAQYAFHALCGFTDVSGRERPKGDGPCKSHLDALGTGKLHCLEADARLATESHNQVVAVIGINEFAPLLILLDFAISGLETQVVGFHHVVIKLKRRDDVLWATVFATVDCPWALAAYLIFGTARALLGEHHFLHHLANDTVSKDNRHTTVFECQVPSKSHKVGHFLNRRRREHYCVIIAMATTLASLKVVGL